MTSKYDPELLRLIKRVHDSPDQSPERERARDAFCDFVKTHVLKRMRAFCNYRILEDELESLASDILYRVELGEGGLIPRMLEKYPNVNLAYLRTAADRKMIDYFESLKNQDRHLSIEQSQEDHDLHIRRNPLDQFSVGEWESDDRDDQQREYSNEQINEAFKNLKEEEQYLLQSVYVNQTPIEDLAEEVLNLHPLVLKGSRVGQPRTIEQARNLVDQRLTRVRQKMKIAIEKSQSENTKGGEA